MALTYHEVNDIMNHIESMETTLPQGGLEIVRQAFVQIRKNELEKKKITDEEFDKLPPETEFHPSSEMIWKLCLGEVDKLEHQGDAE